MEGKSDLSDREAWRGGGGEKGRGASLGERGRGGSSWFNCDGKEKGWMRG